MEQNSEMLVLYDTGTVVTLERSKQDSQEDFISNIISVFTLDNHTKDPTF